ncbi:ASCH domain-containing protein [Chryseobacterium limigenitum]|nr:ASCH domain-containing protein [Chryseobacterium limigenitum]
MKFLYFFVFALFFSCTKSLEDRCFTKGEEKSDYVEEKPYTVKQILEEKPDYLEIINLDKFRSFKKDSSEYRSNYYSSEANEQYWKDQKIIFVNFEKQFFGQFEYSFKQNNDSVQYALGRNGLGYWLLEIRNNQPSAYFLGLSFSHYYFNKIQENPIVKDGFFQIEGSLVKLIKTPRQDSYAALEDGKLFKIDLKELKKDSDKDGYNDIFEKSFGLNPKNKDSDGDGINDFDDTNPMFRSEKNKFSELYQRLLPEYAGVPNFKQLHYYFEVFETDCDYFHQVNPDYRILFVSEEKNKKSDYIKVTDVFDYGFSKIRKDKTYPNKFYLYEWGSSHTNSYSAEYKNGKWELEMTGQIVS